MAQIQPLYTYNIIVAINKCINVIRHSIKYTLYYIELIAFCLLFILHRVAVTIISYTMVAPLTTQMQNLYIYHILIVI